MPPPPGLFSFETFATPHKVAARLGLLDALGVDLDALAPDAPDSPVRVRVCVCGCVCVLGREGGGW
jgi:hypothetical protein